VSRRRFGVATAVVAASIAVSAAAATAAPPPQVALLVGDEVTMSMRGNAATGFTWRIKSVDRSILKPLGSKYIPAKHPAGVKGTGGTFVFHLRALARGHTLLRFVYAQPFASRESPSYMTISVTVK
jgi:predicted secreted protein